MCLLFCMSTMYEQVPKEARRRLFSFSSPDPIISSVFLADPLPASQPNAGILYSTVDRELASVPTINRNHPMCGLPTTRTFYMDLLCPIRTHRKSELRPLSCQTKSAQNSIHRFPYSVVLASQCKLSPVGRLRKAVSLRLSEHQKLIGWTEKSG